MESYKEFVKEIKHTVANHDDEFLVEVAESAFTPDCFKQLIVQELRERHPNRYERWQLHGQYNYNEIRKYFLDRQNVF